ncbi:MAG TPA: hypothetical protein PK095_01460 [Myxococcota bacterium]|nr:hypothetical protein [Myxococcota bacterium]
MTSPSIAGTKVKPSSVFTSASPLLMACSFTASSAWSWTFSIASLMAWTREVKLSEVKITGRTMRRSSMKRCMSAFNFAPTPAGSLKALGRWLSSKLAT